LRDFVFMKKRTISEINSKKPLKSKLTAISFCGYKSYKDGVRLRCIMCRCECGCYRKIIIKSFLTKARSCGCESPNYYTKHGLLKHPLYNVWRGIKKRCYNPTHCGYKRYGAIGVKMCNEWINDFNAFYNWSILNGWRKGLQIDKDIKANELGVPPDLYSPERCQFVTAMINSRNRHNSIFITYDNKTMGIREWAEYLSIPYGTIRTRYLKGWPPKDILSNKLFPTRTKKINNLQNKKQNEKDHVPYQPVA